MTSPEYIDIINACKAICTDLGVNFINGRVLDLNTYNEKDYPLIYLNDIQAPENYDTVGPSQRTYKLRFFALDNDRADNTPDQRDVIINGMFTLIEQFRNKFIQRNLVNPLSGNIIPAILVFTDKQSGVLWEFTGRIAINISC